MPKMIAYTLVDQPGRKEALKAEFEIALSRSFDDMTKVVAEFRKMLAIVWRIQDESAIHIVDPVSYDALVKHGGLPFKVWVPTNENNPKRGKYV